MKKKYRPEPLSPSVHDGDLVKARRGRVGWRFSWGAFIVAFLMVAGMTTLLYPTAAAWINQYNQSKLISGYEDEVNNGEPPAGDQIALAHDYNNALQFGATVEANHRLPTGFGYNYGELDYSKILLANPSGMMARLNIPSIDLDLPIYHGTDDVTLLRGLGHLEGTSLPVGGENTHSVITGHRGLANMTMFTNLDKVVEGDIFYIEVFGQLLTYQVRETKVVEPEQTESLRSQPGKDLVTLITCTPLGINTHRILVTGERIPTPQNPQIQPDPEVPRFPYWIVIYLVGWCVAIIFIVRSGYPPSASRKVRHKPDLKDGESSTVEE